MMYLGNQAVGLVNNAPLPSFVNNIDSGNIVAQSGDPTGIWIEYKNIEVPKAIFLYSNEFDLTSAKTDKPILGALAAWYIAGTEQPAVDTNGMFYCINASGYAVNWGSDTGGKGITNRSSFSESRGIRIIDTKLHRFYVQGFGTGEYDFKYNIPYHWIAWD